MNLDRLITPRSVWIAIALGATGLVAGSLALTALYHLHPCYLCVFQRLMFMVAALCATGAAWAGGRRPLAPVLALAVLAAACAGLSVSTHQVWLQAQPGAEFMCSGVEDTPLELFVQWLGKQSWWLFGATGNCGSTEMVILGLSLAGWALVAFSGMFIAGAWASWRLWRDARRT